MAKLGWLLCLMSICGALPGCGGQERQGTPDEEAQASQVRNPFGLPDVEDCCGPDSQSFAETVKTDGDADDNAQAWAAGSDGPHGSIEGEWSGRWREEGGEWSTGTATVHSVGERVYIHFRDDGEYLIEARREGDRLVGRYANVEQLLDSLFWTGIIVSNERIDGGWAGGRWDFRRGGGAGS